MKNDAIIQGSLDRCTLATCAKFMRESLNVPLRSKSELVRAAFRIVQEIARRNGGEIIEDIEYATRILDEIGEGGLNPQNRLRRNLIENLQQESLKMDGMEYGKLRVHKHQREQVEIEDFSTALEIYRKSVRRDKSTSQKRERELEEMHKELGKDPRK